jgi:putative ABC transport system permease protein
MLAAVVLILAIGCANVANLLLARGLSRSREFAIRSALGAARFRLARQLAAESLLLSGFAALIGIGIAHWSLRAIVALAPAHLLRLQTAAIDGRILVFAVALAALTAAAFGSVPAWQFSRRISDLLRARQATTGASLRRGLVVAEVAVAVVLLVGAGLLVRSFSRLTAVDPGFEPAGVVMTQVFAGDRHGTPERTRLFFGAAIDRIASLPGVDAAGAVSAMPFALSNINIRSGVQVVGRPPIADGEQPGAFLTIATPGYFRAMSIALREGRLISDSDRENAPAVALISDGLRRREWPDGGAVGQKLRISFQGRPVDVEVVGVVSQIRHDGLDTPSRPELFLPLRQFPFSSMTFVVRGGGEPGALIDRVKQAIWSVDAMQSIYDTASVSGLVERSVVRQRFSMMVMAAVAAVALVLCASGIYGIISITTAQRTREIGVRMALGADQSTIRWMVLREGAAMIASGLLLGLAASALGSGLLRTMLFDVRPTDPATLAAVCVVLAAAGLTACYLPARRATKVDPLAALRIE